MQFDRQPMQLILHIAHKHVQRIAGQDDLVHPLAETDQVAQCRAHGPFHDQGLLSVSLPNALLESS
jgi:hypothetical protein